ncbi:MAG TPA: hypothetical protein V6C82_08640, partial [Chroococcales cyanobacterium]
MIIVMDAKATEEQIDKVISNLEGFGFKTHLSRGAERNIIGAIGDRRQLPVDALTCLPGVLDIVP